MCAASIPSMMTCLFISLQKGDMISTHIFRFILQSSMNSSFPITGIPPQYMCCFLTSLSITPQTASPHFSNSLITYLDGSLTPNTYILPPLCFRENLRTAFCSFFNACSYMHSLLPNGRDRS